MLAAINFLDATSFNAVHLHSGELQAGAGAFIPSGSKGTTPFLATKKAASVKRRSILKPKSKGEVLLWDNGTEKDTDETRIAAETKDDLLVFQQRKKRICSELQIQKHTKEPTEQWFVLEGFCLGRL